MTNNCTSNQTNLQQDRSFWREQVDEAVLQLLQVRQLQSIRPGNGLLTQRAARMELRLRNVLRAQMLREAWG